MKTYSKFMGEIIKTQRVYSLPIEGNQSVVFETNFSYDSWGRIDSMVYPDGETVKYKYDHGGQLKSMQGAKAGHNYIYIDDIRYDKFGAKTYMKYGNNIATNYSYDPHNLRLKIQQVRQANLIINSTAVNCTTNYTYDPKGNITAILSEPYTWGVYQQGGSNQISQTFTYDTADQLTQSQGNYLNTYSLNVNYQSYGKIGNYNLNHAPDTVNTTFTYPAANVPSTSFAPLNSNNGATTYDFGINGSLRRKVSPEHTEYYLFNTFGNMKSYSEDGETYGYYAYDASGERTYKMQLHSMGTTTNAFGQTEKSLEVDKVTYYPNGYINIDQEGNYTKHYYADDQRIASKIGSGSTKDLCTNVPNMYPFLPVWLCDSMKVQLGKTTIPNEKITQILFDTTTIIHLVGDTTGYENELYFYHGNHLSSTQLVTDINANVTQQVFYAPFGEVMSESNAYWHNGQIPDYMFNAKELDEENGMYYYSARYYAPPVFTSRDPLFEKYPFISPYAYCLNNPLIFIDPDGRKVVITGEESEGAVSQMQSRTENLKFTRDANGNISVTGKAKTAEEKYMKNIINNQKITVNVTATNNEKTSSGNDYNIGAFMGNSVEKDANGNVNHVDAFQEYNVSKGADADKKVNSHGNFIWHEIAEGFEGGKISAKNGVSVGPAYGGKPHPVYDPAHYRAGAYFPGQYDTETHRIPIPDISPPYSLDKTKNIEYNNYKLVR